MEPPNLVICVDSDCLLLDQVIIVTDDKQQITRSNQILMMICVVLNIGVRFCGSVRRDTCKISI